MKKVAISAIALALGMGSALAADLPSRKAPPAYIPPPPPLTWNGFYAGLNIGGGWNANSGRNLTSAYWDPTFAFASNLAPNGQTNLFFLPNNNQSGNAGGVIGGLQLGYNFQFNPSIVVGVETDFQGSSLSGQGPSNYAFYPSPFAGGQSLIPVAAINGGNLSLDYIGTVRGRAGWLFTPTLLVYGTAGFAYGGVQRLEPDQHPHRLDRRRRPGVDVRPPLVGQGRISLRRSAERRHHGNLRIQLRLSLPSGDQHRPRRRELSLQLGRSGSGSREVLIDSKSPISGKPGLAPGFHF